jgi:hypothetical protein
LSLYIFDHIPKTGGTSFNFSYLPAAFSARDVLVLPGHKEENRSAIDHLLLCPAEAFGYKILSGHNAFRLRKQLGDADWLTLVRDPVERCISSYLHIKFHDDPANHSLRLELDDCGLGLGDFVAQNWWRQRWELGDLHNLQAKVVLGPDFEVLLKHREKARAQLNARFLLVGYTEAFELFLFAMHLDRGWPLVLFNNRLVRRERETFQLSASDVAKVEAYNAQDRALYDLVRAEFHRKLALLWTSANANLYTRYSTALQQFRKNTSGNLNAVALYADVVGRTL